MTQTPNPKLNSVNSNYLQNDVHHEHHEHGPNCHHHHHTNIQPITREFPKIGRNDPCFCGSGKKFKKCHEQNK